MSEIRAAHAQGDLQRALGFAFGIAVAVGATIGIGILRTPGIVAGHMGNVWSALLIWVLGAGYVMLGVNYTAELATAIPRSGGPYVFAERTLGSFAGIVVGWSDFLNGVFSLAFLAVALAEYGTDLLRPGTDAGWVAAGIVVAFTVINLIGVRAASGAQLITSLAKVTVLWLFVVFCFLIGAPDAAAPQIAPSASTPVTVVGVLLAFQIILGVYTGWRAPSYFAEEAKQPRDIVRALFWGAAAVAITYIAVNLAIVHVVPFETLVNSRLPAADAAGAVASRWGWGETGSMAMTAMAILLLPSTIQGVMMQVSRGLHAMSRDGLFFEIAARVNRRGAPAVSVAIIGAVAVVLVLNSSFDQLFATFAFFGVLNNLLLVYGALRLRQREPDLSRPYRAWLYPWSFLLLLAIDAAVFVGFLVTHLLHSVLTIAGLVALYLLHRRRQQRHVARSGQS
jgi:APA family basic amino acid/polyamine antiporter